MCHFSCEIIKGVLQLRKMIFKAISSNKFQNNVDWYEEHTKWILGGVCKGRAPGEPAGAIS
jgi:hypothetical protein